jgi:hypothetical protein
MAANKYTNSNTAMIPTMMFSITGFDLAPRSYSFSQKRTYNPLAKKNSTTIPI